MIKHRTDSPQETHASKSSFVNASLYVIRSKGYAATTIEDICQHANLSKGSFFHHFRSKQELADAAIEEFSKMANKLFTSAPYHQHADPLDRLLGYIDFRIKILSGDIPMYTCLLGTLVQETYDTHPELRSAVNRAFESHIEMLVKDIELAKQIYATHATWSSSSVAYFIQSVLQGSFIFAKAQQSPEVVIQSLEHLQAYLFALFKQPINQLLQESI